MSRSMTVTVDSRRVSPSRVIRESAGLAPLTMVPARMLLALVDELGGQDQATRFLADIAEQIGRPVGVNLPMADGNSRLMFLAPRAWSQTRLAGWVSGHHAEIEGMFGKATRVAEGDW